MKKKSSSENRVKRHLNIPESLDEMVRKYAEEEDRDYNSAFVRLLKIALGKEGNLERVTKEFKDALEKLRVIEEYEHKPDIGKEKKTGN